MPRGLVPDVTGPDPAPGALSRRRVLTGLALAPVVLVALPGCSAMADDGPDPLVALADAARADAALAAAVVAAEPGLAERVDPLRDARTAHAAALDAEVARQAGDPAPASAPAPAPAGPPVPADAGLPALRSAVEASAAAAAGAALDLPVERAGLVASVSACCATYAAVLG
ncbi:hypothetical protein [Pseudonocardia hydrocarbonoxydans]|uniref:hypothetical protein n=1 Tax=Pseudonocardia hydrocarbonoxydans TaxID=76726 RepID=UPI001144E793|nr:hypothetical protein [Pseudonocardia hydrocarbonoxydans]